LELKYMKMSKLLRASVEAAEVSVGFVAQSLNYRSEGMVRMWLNGSVLPPLNQHHRLAELLGVDVRVLTLGWIIETEPDLEGAMREMLDLTSLSFPSS